VIFAEAPTDLQQISALLQAFGPAALGAVALWWSDIREVRRAKIIADAHALQMQVQATMYEKIINAQDARNAEYLELERDRIKLMTQMLERFMPASSNHQQLTGR